MASSISPADVCRDESSEAVVGFRASSGGHGVDGEPGHLSIEHVRVRQSTGKYRRPLIIGSATGRKKEMLMYSRENNESLGRRRESETWLHQSDLVSANAGVSLVYVCLWGQKPSSLSTHLLSKQKPSPAQVLGCASDP